MNKYFTKGACFFILSTILSFIIPFVILFSLFISLDFYPFGEKSLLIMDMNSQYAHFYEYFRHVINGEGSVFFSWSKSMGTNFFGLFAYYLSSPFSFIVLLFDDINIGIFYMALAKTSFCGATMYIYLRYARKCHSLIIFMFSTSYALMSYNIVYSLCLMWLDAVYLLPLVIIGLEKILKRESPYIFICFLALTITSNYYTGYMVCVFCFLYIIYRYLLLVEKFHIKDFFSVFKKFFLSGVISVCLSLWVMLPAFFDFTSGKLLSESYYPDNLSNFALKDFLQPFLPGNYTGITNAGLPALYNGMLVGLSIMAFFILNYSSVKKKLITLCFFALFLCGFYFTSIEIVWHIFQYPTWFPYRYSFVYHFFVIYVAYEFLSDRVAMHHNNNINLPGWLLKHRHVLPRLCMVCTLLLVCFDMFNNSKALIMGLDNQFRYEKASTYNDFRQSNLALINEIKNNDGSFYRIEKTYEYSYNDALSLNYKGVSHYSSLFHNPLNEFLENLGFEQRHFWISYQDASPITDSVFGIKYILSKYSLPKDYEPIAEIDGITAYINPFVMPLAFVATDGLRQLDLSQNNYFDKHNALLNTLLADNEAYFFPVGGISKYSDNTFSFIVNNNFPIYISFHNQKDIKCRIYVNGEDFGEYSIHSGNIMPFIGQYYIGAEVKLAFNEHYNDISEDNLYVYYFDTDKMYEASRKLNETGFYNITYKNSRINAEVDTEYGGVMFTSIPYDKGFVIKVNGKKTEYRPINDTFIIFDVEAGHHNIEISYISTGFIPGSIISAATLIIIVVGRWFPRRRKENIN